MWLRKINSFLIIIRQENQENRQVSVFLNAAAASKLSFLNGLHRAALSCRIHTDEVNDSIMLE